MKNTATIKTHKVIKNTGKHHGMNYTPIMRNVIMKTGTEPEMRIYFEKLYVRSHKYAKIDLIFDEPRVTKSKNDFMYTATDETSVLFEIRKLSTKELRNFNK